jgi:hypothetical protein
MQYQDMISQVIIHELIHAYDDCVVKNMEWKNCAHHACSEVPKCLPHKFEFSSVVSYSLCFKIGGLFKTLVTWRIRLRVKCGDLLIISMLISFFSQGIKWHIVLPNAMHTLTKKVFFRDTYKKKVNLGGARISKSWLALVLMRFLKGIVGTCNILWKKLKAKRTSIVKRREHITDWLTVCCSLLDSS